MDISETWKKLGKEKLEKPVGGNLKPPGHSSHPVEKLKKNYKIKGVMMVAFVIGFVTLYFLFDGWLIRSVLLVLIIAYVIFMLASFSVYKRLRSELPVDGSLLDMLTETKDQVSRALKFEMISSLMIFPFAGAGGYMMGYTVSGLDPVRIFESVNQIILFIGILTAFGVLGYFMGKKLTKEGYGRYLEEIEGRVRDLKGL